LSTAGDLSITQEDDMPILRTEDAEAIRFRFDDELDADVQLTLVTHNPIGGLLIPGRECDTCQSTQQAVDEITALTSKISVETVDFYREPERAEELDVERIPALIVHGPSGDGVRFFGFPSGYEFPFLLDAIVRASTNESDLEASTVESLSEIDEDVHIKVFVTPT
jgi:alkyl hydroperoxide reductase subunit AhpF